MSSQTEVIETTVSKVSAELTSRGLDPDDRVTITIEPDELIPGRRARTALTTSSTALVSRVTITPVASSMPQRRRKRGLEASP